MISAHTFSEHIFNDIEKQKAEMQDMFHLTEKEYDAIEKNYDKFFKSMVKKLFTEIDYKTYHLINDVFPKMDSRDKVVLNFIINNVVNKSIEAYSKTIITGILKKAEDLKKENKGK